jgi:hypothetical protein
MSNYLDPACDSCSITTCSGGGTGTPPCTSPATSNFLSINSGVPDTYHTGYTCWELTWNTTGVVSGSACCPVLQINYPVTTFAFGIKATLANGAGTVTINDCIYFAHYLGNQDHLLFSIDVGPLGPYTIPFSTNIAIPVVGIWQFVSGAWIFPYCAALDTSPTPEVIQFMSFKYATGSKTLTGAFISLSTSATDPNVQFYNGN